MKVMCIDDKWEDWPKTFTEYFPAPKFGEVVTVVNEEIEDDTTWYYLEEYDSKSGFEAVAFVPISDIDELELVKERRRNIYEISA